MINKRSDRHSIRWQRFSITEFPAHAADWDAIASRAIEIAPFLHSTFFGPLIAEFADGNELLLLGESDDGLRLGSIFRRARKGYWQTFQPSQLPLCAWVANRHDIDWGNVLSSLQTALPGYVLGIGLTQLDPELVARPAESPRLTTLDYVDSAWIEIRGAFDTYWQTCSKNLRQNIRKQRRRLEEEGIVATLETLTDPAVVASAVSDYGQLESAGWKAEGGTAISADNAQGRFYAAMLQSACERGTGVIYRYRFGEQVVAANLCIRSAQTLVVLKTTYDESIKNFSPAFLLRHDVLPQLFADGHTRRLEFFGKYHPWQRQWTSHSRTLFHLTYDRWRVLTAVRRLRARRTELAHPNSTEDGS